jgi:hypothetical protein
MDKDKSISSSGLPQKSDGNDLSMDDFQKAFGVEFGDTIDIDKWHIGQNLAELYPKIEEEWIKVKSAEGKNHKILRETIFPRIKELGLVPHAGLSDNITNIKALIERVHRGFLFNGAVTACDSTISSYPTVPLTISQIGVCLINYERQHGTYSHTLFRHDLRYKSENPVQDALNLIEKRKAENGGRSKGRKMSEIAVRGIRAYMERLLLLDKRNEKSKWILGNGDPIPHELMRGFWAGRKELADKSLGLMKRMVLDHQRFVYVQGCEKFDDLWTFGDALRPFEYLIVDSIEDDLMRRVIEGHTRGQIKEDFLAFAKEVGSKVVRGVYRVSSQAEPQIFYGHIDHIRTAALIAMADSAFQLYQGRPMLLDLASNLCQMSFDPNDIVSTIRQASIKADAKLRII